MANGLFCWCCWHTQQHVVDISVFCIVFLCSCYSTAESTHRHCSYYLLWRRPNEAFSSWSVKLHLVVVVSCLALLRKSFSYLFLLSFYPLTYCCCIMLTLLLLEGLFLFAVVFSWWWAEIRKLALRLSGWLVAWLTVWILVATLSLVVPWRWFLVLLWVVVVAVVVFRLVVSG